MKALYYTKFTTEKAERTQDEFNDVNGALEKYKPKKNSKYVKPREKLLINTQNFYKGRQMIIDAFKNKILPMVHPGFSEDEVEMKRKRMVDCQQ